MTCKDEELKAKREQAMRSTHAICSKLHSNVNVLFIKKILPEWITYDVRYTKDDCIEGILGYFISFGKITIKKDWESYKLQVCDIPLNAYSDYMVIGEVLEVIKRVSDILVKEKDKITKKKEENIEKSNLDIIKKGYMDTLKFIDSIA